MTGDSSPLYLVPDPPPPVPVLLAPGQTALVVIDINEALCGSRPSCMDTLPRISSLLAGARTHEVLVIHTEGGREPTVFLDPAQPGPGEPVIRARADKFHESRLESTLRQAGVTTLLLVGTAANGAIMYTAFAANLRGYTVAVAVDGISAELDATKRFVQWQLVNQPGFMNAENAPLARERVTLTRTDLITYSAP